ncbi:MAG: helix-hairpin-helix domain-containing protein [Bacteroidota bacterium]
MKNILKDYFYYTKAERNGLLILLFLLLALISLPTIYAYFFKPKKIDFTAYQKEITAFTNRQKKPDAPLAHVSKPRALFSFNPNTASVEEFTRLGLSEKLAQTIANYRNKGGQFREAKDFKVIYGLKAEDYDRLEPYITIPKQAARSKLPKNTRVKTKPREISPFPFDPNTADSTTLHRLGLSSRTIRILLNYRAKGGRFRAKEDLSRIYGLHQEDYQRLAPFLQIETPQPLSPKTKISPPSKAQVTSPQKTVIDINQATAKDWQALRGIGPSYSKRIVQYRNLLGGFANVQQLTEVYGIPDSTMQQIQPFLKSSPIFKKIPINTADKKTMAAHPYLNYKKAQVIINYRQQHGPFADVEDLKKLIVLSPKEIKKLQPYLSF